MSTLDGVLDDELLADNDFDLDGVGLDLGDDFDINDDNDILNDDHVDIDTGINPNNNENNNKNKNIKSHLNQNDKTENEIEINKSSNDKQNKTNEIEISQDIGIHFDLNNKTNKSDLNLKPKTNKINENKSNKNKKNELQSKKLSGKKRRLSNPKQMSAAKKQKLDKINGKKPDKKDERKTLIKRLSFGSNGKNEENNNENLNNLNNLAQDEPIDMDKVIQSAQKKMDGIYNFWQNVNIKYQKGILDADVEFETETEQILQGFGQEKQMDLEQINETFQQNQEKRANISKSTHFMLNSMS